MKKIIHMLITTTVLLAIFTIPVFSQNENSDLSTIWDSVDNKTKQSLEELGIDEISFEKLFELKPTRVVSFLIETVTSSGSQIIKQITLIVVLIILTSIAMSFFNDEDKTENIVNIVSTILILSIVIVPISRILGDAIVSIKTSCVFVNAYLPVMTAIIVASKNPALALTYNSFTAFSSSVIATIADKMIMPIISGLLSFNVFTAFSNDNYNNKLIKTIKRCIIIVLSLFSTVFTGLITTQSILASSSDNAVLRGIRFISGTFIPVVGSGVADSLSSVFSSFLIMKNSLGVFVIFVIILINLPTMIELLVWYFALSFCSIVSSMFNLKHLTDIIDSIASILSLLNTVVFFITFILVISTGVILTIGK